MLELGFPASGFGACRISEPRYTTRGQGRGFSCSHRKAGPMSSFRFRGDLREKCSILLYWTLTSARPKVSQGQKEILYPVLPSITVIHPCIGFPRLGREGLGTRAHFPCHLAIFACMIFQLKLPRRVKEIDPEGVQDGGNQPPGCCRNTVSWLMTPACSRRPGLGNHKPGCEC